MYSGFSPRNGIMWALVFGRESLNSLDSRHEAFTGEGRRMERLLIPLIAFEPAKFSNERQARQNASRRTLLSDLVAARNSF